MSGPADPYVLPNGTLRNKLGLTSQGALDKVEARITAGRAAVIEANLPTPPFTFDTLRSIHRELFQDLYAWAGEPRTGTLRKREFDHPGSPAHTFAEPETIVPRAQALFRKLADQRFLAGTSRAEFAAGAAETFAELNAIHFAREGNGRTQRLLLTAMAENAGHPLAFDIITRERMVAISVADHKGDASGIRRMFDEILDPRQVEAMRKATGFLQSGGVKWNDYYIATTRAGQEYTGVLVGQAGADFMLRTSQEGQSRILVGDARDLPPGSASGNSVAFRPAHFAPPEEPGKRPAPALGAIANAMRKPQQAAPLPWEPKPARMADRVRAAEERAAKAKEAAAKPPEPAPDTDADAPRPKSGPKP